MQRGNLQDGLVIAWQPKYPILAVATSSSVSEYDAVSGCRRNQVESNGSPIQLRYSSDGSYLVLLTRERNIYMWSTSTWRHQKLLTAEARYAERPLVSGLLAIGAVGHQQGPVVYYSPIGKTTLRTIHISPPAYPKGQSRPDKMFLPGYKLKSDNKKAIVGLAAHPTDPNILFTLLIDGNLVMQSVGNGTMASISSIIVPFDAKKERVQLQTTIHPILKGTALVFIEAEKSGLTVVLSSRSGVKIMTSLAPHAGAVLAGAGLIHRSLLLFAAFRHVGGNVGLRAWRLLPDSRNISVIPMAVSPSTVWDALQTGFAMAGDAASLADVSGDAIIAGMLPHSSSGLLAFWTSQYDDTGAAHFRIPLLEALDGSHPLEGMGAAFCLSLNTAPRFWTVGAGQMDGVVPKLCFPRYAYVMNTGKVSAYDVSNGLLTDVMPAPPPTATGQERQMVRCVHSSHQNTWISFSRILSDTEDSIFKADTYEFHPVSDSDVSVATGEAGWIVGRDGVFLGARDELTAILSNSGTLIALFETPKLKTPNPKAQSVFEVASSSSQLSGPMIRLFPGPCRHIPTAPQPRPIPVDNEDADPEGDDYDTDDEKEIALREWEEAEVKRLQLPKQLLMLSSQNVLILVDATSSGFSKLVQYKASKNIKASLSIPRLQLRQSEVVIQVSWQTLLDANDDFHAGSEGAEDVLPCVAAVLTSERVIIVDPQLQIITTVNFPGDAGVPTSCLWAGLGLLVSTSANQVFMAGWDGSPMHMASLLSGPPITILGVLADRLILAMRGEGPGLLAGRTETATRGFSVLPVLLLGWAGVASLGILPGGAPRARREMRALLASYDASQLSLAALNALAESGFPKVAAAAASSSELSEVTPARRAAFAAASGDWEPAIELIERELESYPERPPNTDSELYQKMVALGRSLETHGRFSLAKKIFRGAGAWSELLSLCVFQGDFASLQEYARDGGPMVEALAHQLIAVNEDAFRRVGAAGDFGGRALVQDWEVKPKTEVMYLNECPENTSPRGTLDTSSEGLNGEDVSPNEWEVAPSGRIPFMEACLAVTLSGAASGQFYSKGLKGDDNQTGNEDSGQPISALDLSKMDAYLGMTGASVVSSGGKTDKSFMLRNVEGNISSILSEKANLQENLPAHASGHLGGDTTPRSSDMLDLQSIPESEGDSVFSSPVTGASQRNKSKYKSADEPGTSISSFQDDLYDDFFSSDEESGVFPDADDKSAGSFAAATSNRFLFNIRSPDDARSLQSSDPNALRNAAQKLKLGGVDKVGMVSQASLDGQKKHPLQSEHSKETMASADSSTTSIEQLFTFDSQMKEESIASAKSTGQEDPFLAFDALGLKSAEEKDDILAKSGNNVTTLKDKIVTFDPFAELSVLSNTLGEQKAIQDRRNVDQDSSTAPARKPLPEHEFRDDKATTSSQPSSENVPMRPKGPALVPKEDLLSGWADFEALFATNSQKDTNLKMDRSEKSLSGKTTSVAPIEGVRNPSVELEMDVGSQPSPSLQFEHSNAVKTFCQGHWSKAAEYFATCMTKSTSENVSELKQLCLHQYAASLLLQRASPAPPLVASRLSRYAAALKTGDKMRAAATSFAVEANMAAGNYGWAGDQLTWLVVDATENASSGPGLDPQILQERLSVCDQYGNQNANIKENDDDVESFADIVGSCSNKGDVDNLIENLLQV